VLIIPRDFQQDKTYTELHLTVVALTGFSSLELTSGEAQILNNLFGLLM
jgi:hypothetical protein